MLNIFFGAFGPNHFYFNLSLEVIIMDCGFGQKFRQKIQS